MTTRTKPVTYDDYLTLPNDGKKYEIIDGELIMTPSITHTSTSPPRLTTVVYSYFNASTGFVNAARTD